MMRIGFFHLVFLPCASLAALLLLAVAGSAHAANPANGEKIYKNTCAACHNPGANPGPELIKLGANSPATIRLAFNTVLEMDGFSAIFSNDDVEDIAAYLALRFNVTTPPPPVTADALEYYNAGFDHYFVTSIADEITKLDNGTFAGWTRTGRKFSVFAAAGAGRAPVCRFFSTAFAPKSSHFYTAAPDECTAVKANPNWQFEGEVFFVGVPDVTGTCAAGTIPVYRLYNNGQGDAPNHRFTTELQVQGQMKAQGWIPEGFGVGVTMCVPG